MNKNYLRFYASIGFFLCAKIVNAQYAITSAGNSFANESGSITYTIGQLVIDPVTTSEGSIYNGVQQAYEISNYLEIENHNMSVINLISYPNPTPDKLTLKIDLSNNDDLHYQIADMSGKYLSQKKIIESETIIQMSNYAPGVYFIKISQNNKELKIFKIIKK